MWKKHILYAKAIFGNTPEMMTFYSNLLGYDYPWAKYSQVVVKTMFQARWKILLSHPR